MNSRIIEINGFRQKTKPPDGNALVSDSWRTKRIEIFAFPPDRLSKRYCRKYYGKMRSRCAIVGVHHSKRTCEIRVRLRAPGSPVEAESAADDTSFVAPRISPYRTAKVVPRTRARRPPINGRFSRRLTNERVHSPVSGRGARGVGNMIGIRRRRRNCGQKRALAVGGREGRRHRFMITFSNRKMSLSLKSLRKNCRYSKLASGAGD